MATKAAGVVSCDGAWDGGAGAQINSYGFYDCDPRLRIRSLGLSITINIQALSHCTLRFFPTCTPLTEQRREPLADSTAGLHHYTISVSRCPPIALPKATWAGGEANIVYKSGIDRCA